LIDVKKLREKLTLRGAVYVIGIPCLMAYSVDFHWFGFASGFFFSIVSYWITYDIINTPINWKWRRRDGR